MAAPIRWWSWIVVAGMAFGWAAAVQAGAPTTTTTTTTTTSTTTTTTPGASKQAVTLCHQDGPTPRTIVVNVRSVPAHLAHGDTLGPCP